MVAESFWPIIMSKLAAGFRKQKGHIFFYDESAENYVCSNGQTTSSRPEAKQLASASFVEDNWSGWSATTMVFLAGWPGVW